RGAGGLSGARADQRAQPRGGGGRIAVGHDRHVLGDGGGDDDRRGAVGPGRGGAGRAGRGGGRRRRGGRRGGRRWTGPADAGGVRGPGGGARGRGGGVRAAPAGGGGAGGGGGGGRGDSGPGRQTGSSCRRCITVRASSRVSTSMPRSTLSWSAGTRSVSSSGT